MTDSESGNRNIKSFPTVTKRHTAAEYREMADECFEWTAGALTDKIRATYISIARMWLEAAAQLDGGLPVRRAHVPDPKQGNGKSNEPS